MTQQSIEMRAQLFNGFGQSRLRDEIIRLRNLCAKAEEAASRYATMLREGDHRIKNSLQIVASLMGLQANREPSESARDALRAAAARVRSIAQIHDALQASSGADAVDLGQVLSRLCESLEGMAGDPRGVSVVVDAKSVLAPAIIAQPIVLMVNELVVNALRHAFPDGRRGIVYVSAVQGEKELTIVVADDGRGMPEGHDDAAGYGLTLVRMLAAQVGGTLETRSLSGMRITLRVPRSKTAGQVQW